MAKVKRVSIAPDLSPEEEEEIISEASTVILDKKIKSELNYSFIISKALYDTMQEIQNASANPTLQNISTLLLQMKATTALISPYLSKKFKEQMQEHINRINELDLTLKEARYEAIQEVIEWFSDLMQDMHRSGMLFKESIATVV